MLSTFNTISNRQSSSNTILLFVSISSQFSLASSSSTNKHWSDDIVFCLETQSSTCWDCIKHLSSTIFLLDRQTDDIANLLVPSQSRTCARIYIQLQCTCQSRSIDACLHRWVSRRNAWRNRRINEFSSTVVLYDLHTHKQDFIINTARKAITSLALSPDGRYLATGEVGPTKHRSVRSLIRSLF